MANFLTAATLPRPRKMGESSRGSTRTYPIEVSEPELGKVPGNCGKHLHTQILAQNHPPVLYCKPFIINVMR